jgi:hypothetical protein
MLEATVLTIHLVDQDDPILDTVTLITQLPLNSAGIISPLELIRKFMTELTEEDIIYTILEITANLMDFRYELSREILDRNYTDSFPRLVDPETLESRVLNNACCMLFRHNVGGDGTTYTRMYDFELGIFEKYFSYFTEEVVTLFEWFAADGGVRKESRERLQEILTNAVITSGVRDQDFDAVQQIIRAVRRVNRERIARELMELMLDYEANNVPVPNNPDPAPVVNPPAGLDAAPIIEVTRAANTFGRWITPAPEFFRVVKGFRQGVPLDVIDTIQSQAYSFKSHYSVIDTMQSHVSVKKMKLISYIRL